MIGLTFFETFLHTIICLQERFVVKVFSSLLENDGGRHAVHVSVRAFVLCHYVN
jgi:hypothetical protein